VTWQVASFFGWPVSTTHCIIGAMVGFGLGVRGPGAVYWASLNARGLLLDHLPSSGPGIAYIVYPLHPPGRALEGWWARGVPGVCPVCGCGVPIGVSSASGVTVGSQTFAPVL